MKRLICFFILLRALRAAEHPSCYINRLPLNGTSADVFGFQARNQDDLSNTLPYTVRIYADDPTFTSLTDYVELVTSGGTANYTISNAVFGTGTKNLRDGSQHTLYMLMFTHAGPALTTCTGQAWPYKYDVGAAGDDFTYPLATATQATGATYLNLSVIVIPGLAYSTGTSGLVLCTVNGTQVRADGAAGYYIQKYGIPCGHVHTFPIATTATVTITAAQTAYAAMSPALGSDEQFNALAWVFPYGVTNITSTGSAGTLTNDTMSMAGFFANLGQPMTNQTITTSNQVAEGDSTTSSPYFRSASIAPFTDLAFRPTFQLAWQVCDGVGTLCSGGAFTGTWTANFPAAKAGIDASFAARGSHPPNGVIYTQNNSGDFGRSAQYSLTPQKAYGLNTGVAPSSTNTTVTAIVSTSTTINSTSILGYELASGTPSGASSPSFIAPGIGYMIARTSFSGQLDVGSVAPTTAYLLMGAAFSCGSGAEPFGMISTKYPEEMLMMSLYTRGKPAIEAAWMATRQPYNMVCVGDPLAQYILPAIGTTLSGSVRIGTGVTTQ